MTQEAFENAITVDMGIGGSSNTVLHLTAIAHEVGIELPPPLFDCLQRNHIKTSPLRPNRLLIYGDQNHTWFSFP